jgi:hypothetical protein
MEIVTVNDMHYDYTLLSAQLELNRVDPTFIVGPGSFSLLSLLPHMKNASCQVPSPHHLP